MKHKIFWLFTVLFVFFTVAPVNAVDKINSGNNEQNTNQNQNSSEYFILNDNRKIYFSKTIAPYGISYLYENEDEENPVPIDLGSEFGTRWFTYGIYNYIPGRSNEGNPKNYAVYRDKEGKTFDIVSRLRGNNGKAVGREYNTKNMGNLGFKLWYPDKNNNSFKHIGHDRVTKYPDFTRTDSKMSFFYDPKATNLNDPNFKKLLASGRVKAFTDIGSIGETIKYGNFRYALNEHGQLGDGFNFGADALSPKGTFEINEKLYENPHLTNRNVNEGTVNIEINKRMSGALSKYLDHKGTIYNLELVPLAQNLAKMVNLINSPKVTERDKAQTIHNLIHQMEYSNEVTKKTVPWFNVKLQKDLKAYPKDDARKYVEMAYILKHYAVFSTGGSGYGLMVGSHSSYRKDGTLNKQYYFSVDTPKLYTPFDIVVGQDKSLGEDEKLGMFAREYDEKTKKVGRRIPYEEPLIKGKTYQIEWEVGFKKTGNVADRETYFSDIKTDFYYQKADEERLLDFAGKEGEKQNCKTHNMKQVEDGFTVTETENTSKMSPYNTIYYENKIKDYSLIRGYKEIVKISEDETKKFIRFRADLSKEFGSYYDANAVNRLDNSIKNNDYAIAQYQIKSIPEDFYYGFKENKTTAPHLIETKGIKNEITIKTVDGKPYKKGEPIEKGKEIIFEAFIKKDEKGGKEIPLKELNLWFEDFPLSQNSLSKRYITDTSGYLDSRNAYKKEFFEKTKLKENGLTVLGINHYDIEAKKYTTFKAPSENEIIKSGDILKVEGKLILPRTEQIENSEKYDGSSAEFFTKNYTHLNITMFLSHKLDSISENNFIRAVYAVKGGEVRNMIIKKIYLYDEDRHLVFEQDNTALERDFTVREKLNPKKNYYVEFDTEFIMPSGNKQSSSADLKTTSVIFYNNLCTSSLRPSV